MAQLTSLNPTLMLLAGIVIMTVTLLLRARRKSKKLERHDTNPSINVKTSQYAPQASQHLANISPMLAQHRQVLDQWEADVLQMTRQYRSEIDTKIVALQLLAMEASRQSEELQKLVEKAEKLQNFETPPPVSPSPPPSAPTPPSSPAPTDQPSSETTSKSDVVSNPESNPEPSSQIDQQNQSVTVDELMTYGAAIDKLSHNFDNDYSEAEYKIEEIQVIDPFADLGGTEALKELEQISSRVANLELDIESLGLESSIRTVVEPPAVQESEIIIEEQAESWTPSVANAAPKPLRSSEYPVAQTLGEELGKATIIRGLFPEFDDINRKPPKRRSSPMTASIAKPPQLETILEPDDQKSRESIPFHAPTADGPKASSPRADTIINGGVVYMPDEQTDITVRQDKRHQVLFLAKKGVTAREIAAFNGMPLGEVEMILNSQTPTRAYRSGYAG